MVHHSIFKIVMVGNPIGNREIGEVEYVICGTVVYQAFIGGYGR